MENANNVLGGREELCFLKILCEYGWLAERCLAMVGVWVGNYWSVMPQTRVKTMSPITSVRYINTVVRYVTGVRADSLFNSKPYTEECPGGDTKQRMFFIWLFLLSQTASSRHRIVLLLRKHFQM